MTNMVLPSPFEVEGDDGEVLFAVVLPSGTVKCFRSLEKAVGYKAAIEKGLRGFDDDDPGDGSVPPPAPPPPHPGRG